MGIFGWSYPPGESGRATETEYRFRCNNEECERCGETWTATGFTELGSGFLDNDDDAYCAGCGREATEGGDGG
jgi:hypothetical protein